MQHTSPARLACLLLALLLPGAALAQSVETPHVRAELIAENTALVPGTEPNWIALRLHPENGWHVYWQNPGDSGLPTKLVWSLPAGASAGDILWPYPEAEKLGDLTNYGYGSDTLHLVPLTVATGTAGPLALKAVAKWLVCSDVCIPGSATLTLTLPVADKATADTRWSALFADTRAKVPQPAPAQWQASFSTAADGDLTLQIAGAGFAPSARFEFFPLTSDLVTHSAAQHVTAADGVLRLSQKLSPYFVSAPDTVHGVLLVHDGNKNTAYTFSAQPGTVAAVSVDDAQAHTTATTDQPGLALVLLFALLGGLILNLMPCVFPVLSLKALSLMQGRAHDAAHQRAHALAYTAGVMLSCAAVAALLLALRAGGAALGWGFQLQSPAFVGALAYLMFALGLSMSGLFEFGTRWMGAGQSLTERSGLAGSFFTGVLATVVASPCTAPFMGTALGYAISQPLLVSLPVFLALGLGLALPFLLLGFFPRLAALLPRPGAWMETFKQVMAFPLYLTAVWLLWVLSRQAGADGAGLVLCGMVLIAFALWLLRRTGVFARVLRWFALAAAALLLASPMLRPQDAANLPTQGEAWSETRVAQLRAEHRTIFVDFTADWCLTCKVNEHGVLASKRVRVAFEQNNVAVLTADWTRSDPAITQALAQFGRNGVPLYLVYVRGGEPKVLPQVLTPGVIVEALTP